MIEAGLIVLVSMISPFRNERRLAREIIVDDEFIEIFVDAPVQVCEQTDTKGLYRKAHTGLLPNFTGIGSPYDPELTLSASTEPPERLAAQIMSYLRERGIA